VFVQTDIPDPFYYAARPPVLNQKSFGLSRYIAFLISHPKTVPADLLIGFPETQYLYTKFSALQNIAAFDGFHVIL